MQAFLKEVPMNRLRRRRTMNPSLQNTLNAAKEKLTAQAGTIKSQSALIDSQASTIGSLKNANVKLQAEVDAADKMSEAQDNAAASDLAAPIASVSPAPVEV